MNIENFLGEHKIHCLEGDKGVEALNLVCKEIGYSPDGFRYGSSLENFLKDNTGATQVLLDWIEKHHPDTFGEDKDEDYDYDAYVETVTCKECDHSIDKEWAEQHNGLCSNCEAKHFGV
jgi:hypothetical protein